MSRAREQIESLLYTYAERMDLGDFEGVAELFENATYRGDGTPPLSGREELLEVLNGLIVRYDGIPRTKHVTTNVILDVDEDAGTATGRAYFSVFQACEGIALQPIVCGRYHDRFVCQGGKWRFADRLVFMDLIGDLSRHLKGQVG